MNELSKLASSLERLEGVRFCTESQRQWHREEWLREIIGKQYANIEITPPTHKPLYNDMILYPMNNNVRFSPIVSNPITLERLPKEPTDISHDCYFVVVLLSGEYRIEQNGRDTFLKPGEMTIYDATEPHKIIIPTPFSKLLISIPRTLIDSHLHNVSRLTASKLSTHKHLNLATTHLLKLSSNLDKIERTHFQNHARTIIELIQSNLLSNGAQQREITPFRAMSLLRVKNYIHSHLDNDNLDAHQIADNTHLSVRYINELFKSENTSLMRFVTEKRLERSRQFLENQYYSETSITDIALRCGFKNCSHFSRIFKTRYEYSPRSFRLLHSAQLKLD